MINIVVLAVLVGGAVAARPAHAAADSVQGRQLTITEFDVTYRVRPDGALDVEERIRIRFDGSWRGIYRWIPVVYELSDGGRHRIRLDLTAVEDGGGASLRHETSREGALVRIKTYVPDAQDTERTVVFRYRVGNGLRFFRGDDGIGWDHDELYWNVTGDEWEMPILAARATVQLPDAATGVRAAAYTGARGGRGEDYRSRIAGNTVTFETTRPLAMREGLTIVVGWDPGLVERPGEIARARWLIADYPFVWVPVAAFGFMFWLWRRRGRDPELRRSVMPRYEPPPDMKPAEVGTLMDFNVDARDLSATIIDLAVRGYLRIEEVPGRILKRPRDHIIHILKSADENGTLTGFERELLQALGRHAIDDEGSPGVRVSKLKQKFYRDADRIEKQVYRRLSRETRMFTARPDRVKARYLGLAVAAGVVGTVIAINATNAGIGRPAGVWLSFLSVVPIVAGFGIVMPARSLKGAGALVHVLGLREYIDRVDRHRLKHATLEHFETLLPYAAAMGLEEKWTEAFEGILVQPPAWYVSRRPGAFHASSFSRSLGRMSSATGAALTTAPRSASSGSGFGGGGGSGGGFGGGGGGGF